MNAPGLHRVLVLALLLLALALPARSEPRTLVITDGLQLGLAESFMAEGEYYRAITEYKKFLYFFPDASQAGYVRLQIGLAYYRGGECPQAIEAFAKVRQHYPSEHFATAAFNGGVCRSRLKSSATAADDFERALPADPASSLAPQALTCLALTALDRHAGGGSGGSRLRLGVFKIRAGQNSRQPAR